MAEFKMGRIITAMFADLNEASTNRKFVSILTRYSKQLERERKKVRRLKPTTEQLRKHVASCDEFLSVMLMAMDQTKSGLIRGDDEPSELLKGLTAKIRSYGGEN